MQGVFLIVAQAAVKGAPCPSDAALAHAYGTHSRSRARRLLTYFEERGLVVVRTDFHGRRIGRPSPTSAARRRPATPRELTICLSAKLRSSFSAALGG